MSYTYESYDVIVVGAGHAGCEAVLAAARLGHKTLMFTVSVDSIALMPCNPNIGGTSKGHLVREIDALGGEMGKNIDRTFIQSKMLNASKGPAVHSLRAQADKQAYSREMRKVLEAEPNVVIKQGEVAEILVSEDETAEGGIPAITGIMTTSKAIYPAKCVILCTGTYLRARCIYGDVEQFTGPNGLMAANALTASLLSLGIRLRRFKTGTPARIDGNSIDFSKLTPQYGDETIVPFSFTNKAEDLERDQVPCYLTYTNETTHQIIRENIDRSPLYSGKIQGTGPRYCPSIEDKVMRFADKDRHQVFLEPEGLYTNEIYVDGMSSSMPEDVQIRMYRSVPGLEHANIVRNAYAIEYDCIDATQLKESLEFQNISGLFAAGQFNGSSGYEEAGAQGLIAGINAALKIENRDPLILSRSDGYIGVLIDDLVTKETMEPYRMMTSRAEYRLLLRQDNADLRLTKYGYEVGLIPEERYQAVEEKRRLIKEEEDRLEEVKVGGSAAIQSFLEKYGSPLLKTAVCLADLIRRPELTYDQLAEIDPDRPLLDDDVREQININIKYKGYLEREFRQVEQFQKLESRKIPTGIDFESIANIRKEARQKLAHIKPETVGQASRISGVSPADISVLIVYLQQYARDQERNQKNG